MTCRARLTTDDGKSWVCTANHRATPPAWEPFGGHRWEEASGTGIDVTRPPIPLGGTITTPAREPEEAGILHASDAPHDLGCDALDVDPAIGRATKPCNCRGRSTDYDQAIEALAELYDTSCHPGCSHEGEDEAMDAWADKLAEDACHPDALGNERAVLVTPQAIHETKKENER